MARIGFVVKVRLGIDDIKIRKKLGVVAEAGGFLSLRLARATW